MIFARMPDDGVTGTKGTQVPQRKHQFGPLGEQRIEIHIAGRRWTCALVNLFANNLSSRFQQFDALRESHIG